MERMPGQGPQPTVEEYLTRLAPRPEVSANQVSQTSHTSGDVSATSSAVAHVAAPGPETLDEWTRYLAKQKVGAQRRAEAADEAEGSAAHDECEALKRSL
jgi:hypothetical protein